jgi:L-proline cis-4-hydroxylase
VRLSPAEPRARGAYGLRSHALGAMPLDPQRLAPELATLAGWELRTCTGYAVGSWGKCILLEREAPGAPLAVTAHGAALPYVVERIERAFRTELLRFAQIFVAREGGYVRPHRDWDGEAPMFARVHVPLQTDDGSLHAEDDLAYHMRRGEIWFVDASRAHSAGCFSATTPRVHLVLDFVPGVALGETLREGGYEPLADRDPRAVRAPFTAAQLAAVHGLARIATERTFSRIADLLGTLHFAYDVDCAALYDWLDEIARRADDGALAERAREMRRTYLDPFGPR